MNPTKLTADVAAGVINAVSNAWHTWELVPESPIRDVAYETGTIYTVYKGLFELPDGRKLLITLMQPTASPKPATRPPEDTL